MKKTMEAKAATKAMTKAMTKDELNGKIAKGEAFQLLNVLAPEYYDLGMIKGSIKIPLAELEARFSELDKAKEVVTYCASASCDSSRKAAKLLASKGFNVSAYEGGIKEWTASKLPVDEKATPALSEQNA